MSPLVHPKVHPKLLSKLRILCYFSKTWLKIWRNSWWSSLFGWNRSILQIFLFFACYIFCCWEKPPAMHGWKKIVFMKPYLYFLSLKHFRLFVFVKNYYDRFFTNIFIKPENINEKSQSCMTGVCPPGKFLFPLKQWRILKLLTQLLSWIVFTTKMIFYKKKVEISFR